MKLFQRLTQRWHALIHESAVRAAYEDGRFDDGVAHARALYDFDLDNPWANFFLACHHLETERYGEALGHLERVREDWPEDAYTHFALGCATTTWKTPAPPSVTTARCSRCPRNGSRPARTWAVTCTCWATTPARSRPARLLRVRPRRPGGPRPARLRVLPPGQVRGLVRALRERPAAGPVQPEDGAQRAAAVHEERAVVKA